MNRQDFKQALRDKLRQVPYEARKTWDGTKLMMWWWDVEKEDSYLRLKGCTDHWQEVHSICMDMYGERAML
ncbi:hypothetical protein AWV80_25820 [Cupriavidus sp. UYMU48A]|nr:hypothetical protein AWV80_25820 [Cupriavidus sp. UYMU48A]